jgi:hypothetical protein
MRGFELEAGLFGQGTQLSSSVIDVAGMVYRAGLDVAIARRFVR